MTREYRDFTDSVEAWLASAPAEEDPESVLARIVADLDSTPQNRWPWTRLSRMSVVAAFATGAVATLIVVVLGAQLLGVLDMRNPGPGAPDDGGSRAEVADIAFVDAAYGNATADVTDVTIRTVPSGGGPSTVLVEVPGAPWRRDYHAPLGDPRNSERVGPAVNWSPDGSRIAFRLFNEAPGIYVMNRDGSGLRQVVDLPRDRDSGMGFSAALDWSPDGDGIVYSYPYGQQQAPLYLVDVADGRITTLVGYEDGGVTRTVAWSPDGASIAFVRTDRGGLPRGSALFIMNADGTDIRQVSTGSESNPQVLGIAWSPDSSMIAFSQVMARVSGGAPERWVFRVVNADGTGLRDLVGPEDSAGCCAWTSYDLPVEWSPDGTSVAMVGGVPEDHDVVLVNVDGSGQRAITEGGDFTWFDWSPDGSELVVFDERTYSVQVVNADGSGRRWLASGEFPVWAPTPRGD